MRPLKKMALFNVAYWNYFRFKDFSVMAGYGGCTSAVPVPGEAEAG